MIETKEQQEKREREYVIWLMNLSWEEYDTYSEEDQANIDMDREYINEKIMKHSYI
jgi:hypothetical protein